MTESLFPLAGPAQSPISQSGGGGAAPRLGSKGGRIGRPPKAAGKRSADLVRYIEAQYGGLTPGQVAAELALVKPADLKKAARLAAELGISGQGLPDLMLAMVVKAEQLAKALDVPRVQAWIILQKERENLLPYVHQRQAPAADKKPGATVTAFLIPEGQAGQDQLADMTPDDDEAGLEIIGETGAP